MINRLIDNVVVMLAGIVARLLMADYDVLWDWEDEDN